MRARTKMTGFTLIELMIVVVLLAIFASIAIPSFTQFLANNRLQGAANELRSLLIAARTDAVTKRSPVTVTENSGTWNASQGGADVRSLSVPSSVTATPSANSLTFNADGTASAVQIAVSSSNASSTYTITTSLPGVIKMQRSSSSSQSGGTP